MVERVQGLRVRRLRRIAMIGVTALLAAMTPFLTVTGANATQVTGAGFTTTNPAVDGTDHCQNGNELVNCNLYDGKQYVWLNGGPVQASVGDGTYFFAVLVPGGQADPNDGTAKNLSDDYDAYTNRTFTVSGGTVSYSGSHDFSLNKIRLAPYADTSNPGGVYIMALCKIEAPPNNVYPVDPDSCKYDAFKIRTGYEVTDASNPTITKDAAGAYSTTWNWGIQKSVDKTLVKQAGGSATFTYTASVTHDSGTNSGVTVTGTIDVVNPNFDDSLNTVPFTVSSVTDQLSDGTVCTVDTSGGLVLDEFDNLFPYSCSLAELPYGELDNTATVTWADGTLSNGNVVTAGSDSFIFQTINFTQTKIDNSVVVTDVFNGGTGTTIGTVTATDPSPKLITYSKVIPVPTYGCLSYDNTATFTTNTTGTTGSSSQTVTVCGPINTGALTIGFWQNKNGQAIITGGSSVSGVCKSGTWLRQYAPFQNLSETATCAQVGTYVTNVIKAANASGAAMNAMLKAQMLATALNVYFSDPALGLNKISAPAPIGQVSIDLTKVCKMIDGTGGTATCGAVYQNVSAAFGGATSLTVSQILAYAASQSNAGGSVWYAQVKATQELAKNTFDAINNRVVFAP